MNAMSSLETRNVTRDSLFLFAELVLDGQLEKVRVKVRNLSAGGMMAECGDVDVARGNRLTVHLRNVGAVKGSVAWAQGDRFGIAFESPINPKLAREPVAVGGEAPAYTRPALAPKASGQGDRPIRNI